LNMSGKEKEKKKKKVKVKTVRRGKVKVEEMEMPEKVKVVPGRSKMTVGETVSEVEEGVPLITMNILTKEVSVPP